MWLLLNVEETATHTILEIPISTFYNLPQHARDHHLKPLHVATRSARHAKFMHSTWKFCPKRTRILPKQRKNFFLTIND
jgi:hypothetical protein